MSKAVTTATLILDALLFGATLAVNDFDPPRWIFVFLAVLAVLAGAFQIHREQEEGLRAEAAVRERALQDQIQELRLQRAEAGQDDKADALERLLEKRDVGPTETVPANIDSTPKVEVSLSHGRAYDFSVASEPTVSLMVARMEASQSGKPVPEAEALPEFHQTLHLRLRNMGPTVVDLLSVEVRHGFGQQLPFIGALAKPEQELPLSLQAQAPLSLDVVTVIHASRPNAAGFAASLAEVSHDTKYTVTVQLHFIAPDGKQNTVALTEEIAVVPLIDEVLGHWRKHGYNDLLRYANAG